MGNTMHRRSVELYYEKIGEGTPIVFLHGFGASIYSWRHLTAPFSKHNSLYLIDLLGFGSSPKPLDGDYSLYNQAALVYDFIMEKDLRDLVLLGHSFGGGVTLLVALKLHSSGQVGRLRSLILIDTIGYPQELPAFISILRTPLIGALSVSLFPPEFQVRMVLNLAFHDDRKITEAMVSAYATPLTQPGGQRALLETARNMVPYDLDVLVKEYKSLSIPVLLIWGQHDKIVPLRIGQLLNHALPNSTLHTIENVGHVPHEENPAAVIPIIASFLQQH